ncbi:hypothetical protein NLU13_9682 [Sarocladium strictum]|uniref:HpcH/HpaI aldolase/citrate lyase domain-containing protein n=1 Tax=Sarocladium strictum TaxID=5046 RepID=A0AA39GB24_SARSR|nr:hypothetical protein NLU13_9682 [Sarocladium strictum]
MTSANGVKAGKFTLSSPLRTMILSGVVCPLRSVKFISSNNIALMCKMAGISGMFIDMEHSTLQLREMAQLILWHISTDFDSGAACVAVLHIESVEETVPTTIQNEVLNWRTMLFPMIKTPREVELVNGILPIDGNNGILIGSKGLITDMGIPGKHDDLKYQ